MPLDIALDVIAIAVVYSSVTFVIQRKVSNIKRVNEITKAMKAMQKEFTAMAKAKAPDADMKKKQDEMMKLMNESMKYQMKALVVVIPLFLAVYYVLLPYLMGVVGVTTQTTDVITSPLALAYPTLFIGIAFLTGILLLIAVSVRDRMRSKAAARLQQAGTDVPGALNQ